jgi:hypothetical protein
MTELTASRALVLSEAVLSAAVLVLEYRRKVKNTTRQYKMPQSAGLPSRLQNAVTKFETDSSTSTSTAALSTSTNPTVK